MLTLVRDSVNTPLAVSEGLWKSKCAIERSMGFVSVSISINSEDLQKHQEENELE